MNKESKSKMYSERVGNISAFRGCGFGCIYCAFRASLKRSPCEKCSDFEPHAHLEVLNKRPPKTKEGEFLTIGLTGDISFASDTTMQAIIHYCFLWSDRTFLIQTKDPSFFHRYNFPENVILGTTIETTTQKWDTKEQWARNDEEILSYSNYSKAPLPYLRYRAMQKLDYRKALTIEPVMDFDFDIMVEWIKEIDPEFVYIGYNSNDKIKLPEPSIKKTLLLIEELSRFTEVRPKLLRKAWWEE